MDSKILKILVGVILAVLVLAVLFLCGELQKLKHRVVTVQPPVIVDQRRMGPMMADPFAARRSGYGRAWDPFKEMEAMQRYAASAFNDLDSAPAATEGFGLRTDFQNQGDYYLVQMDLPGMDKNKIDVEIKGDQLVVSGRRDRTEKVDRKNFYSQERDFGSFYQSVRVPEDADTGGISVGYKSGVLTVRIPKLSKKQEKEAPTKIKIE